MGEALKTFGCIKGDGVCQKLRLQSRGEILDSLLGTLKIFNYPIPNLHSPSPPYPALVIIN